ncbi:MAG: Uma2 family endonuclease [Planctomycetes bacterium]|nr:Uma2 family endonuclease [Planctomycetota bacterium]
MHPQMARWLAAPPEELYDSSFHLKPELVEELKRIGPHAAEDLRDVLARGESGAKALACAMLAELGRDALPALTEVVTLARTGGETELLAAINVLDALGEAGQAALLELVRDGTLEAGRRIEALCQLGPEHLDAFVGLLDDPHVAGTVADIILDIAEEEPERVGVNLVMRAQSVEARARIAGNLAMALGNHVLSRGLGRVWEEEPIEVVFPTGERARVDFAFAASGRDVPDLIVEIVPAEAFDRRELYARHGVKEVWLVAPERRHVVVLGLSNDVRAEFEGRDVIVSPLLQGMRLKVRELYE